MIATAPQQGTGDPRTQENSAATGVRYFDGTVNLAQPALAAAGVGSPFGQEQLWSNAAGYAGGSGGADGSGWSTAQLPFLVADGSSTVVVSGATARYFDLSGGVYTERFAMLDRLSYDAGSDQYTVTDPTGAQLVFAGLGSSWSGQQGGKLLSYSDSTGGTTAKPWGPAGYPLARPPLPAARHPGALGAARCPTRQRAVGGARPRLPQPGLMPVPGRELLAS